MEQSENNQEQSTLMQHLQKHQQQTETAELQLSDGQTDSLPDLQPANLNSQENADLLQTSYSEMMTSDSRYFSRDEFATEFNNFLAFLKNPATATDTFETLRAEGQELAAEKIYNMACRYKWLKFLIDKRAQVVHDVLVMSIFAVTESNAIVYNWTGISLIEKGKIWLRGKVKQRAQQAQTSGKRSVWGFLARRGAEKAQNQENSSESLNV